MMEPKQVRKLIKLLEKNGFEIKSLSNQIMVLNQGVATITLDSNYVQLIVYKSVQK